MDRREGRGMERNLEKEDVERGKRDLEKGTSRTGRGSKMRDYELEEEEEEEY